MIQKATLMVFPVFIVLFLFACGSDRDVGKLHDRSLALVRMGMNEEAMKTIRQALEAEPGRFDLLETYWELKFKQDEGAVDELKGLQEENPNDPFYPRLLSVLLEDPAERLEAGRRAMKLTGEDPEVYLALIDAFIDPERADSAEIYCSKVLALDPSMARASLRLAGLVADRGDLERAETIYRTVLDRGRGTEEYDTAVQRLFAFYWDEKETPGATEVARIALTNVRDPWVLDHLAYIMADANFEISLAESLSLKGIEGMNAEWIAVEYPEIDAGWATGTSRRYRGYLYGTLGFVYSQAGKTSKAVDALEEAVTLIPYADSEILEELASAYEELGRHDEAIESLLDILAVSMNDEAMSQLETTYAEKYGDTTGVHALVAEKRKAVIEPATDFRMASLTGETVTLSDFKGKVVLLDFWFPT